MRLELTLLHYTTLFLSSVFSEPIQSSTLRRRPEIKYYDTSPEVLDDLAEPPPPVKDSAIQTVGLMLSFKNNDTSSVLTKPGAPVVEDDDLDYEGQGQEWYIRDTIHGYEVYSDGLPFKSKLLPDQKKILVRVDMPSPWILTKEIRNRKLHLSVATWNGKNRVHIKVPYGITPEELEVDEQLKYVDIFGPHGFLEHTKEVQTTTISPGVINKVANFLFKAPKH